jgi:hypothetical protein
MAKELTDVPPPGKITLKDVHPSLAKYEGDPKADFLVQAKDNDGKPIDWTYVRLGVSSYDDFFKTAQQTYATVYETDQSIHRMRELITTLKIEGSAQLKDQVDKGLGAEGSADAEVIGDLKAMKEVGGTLATLVSQMGSNVGKLVSTGQALVTSAPTSLTNPKVATHLGLIKDGLGASVKDLTGFGTADSAGAAAGTSGGS